MLLILLIVILVLAFYPQFILRRTEATLARTVAAADPTFVATGWTGYAPLTASTP